MTLFAPTPASSPFCTPEAFCVETRTPDTKWKSLDVWIRMNGNSMTSKARGADGMGSFHKLIHMHGAAWRVLAVGVFGVMLLGCAHHAPAVIRQRMVVISGKGTAQDNPKDAARKVLIEAAAIIP